MNHEDLTIQYHSNILNFNKFNKYLKTVLENNLRLSGFEFVLPIESRVKDFNSLLNKFEKRSTESKHKSLSEFTDIIGLRIIVLYESDILIVHKLIEKFFTILKSDNKTINHADADFGYNSLHLDITLNNYDKRNPANSDFSELTAEIQIRTLSQHVWALASHNLQYKNESDIPNSIKRSIHRLSALFEVIDNELERIKKEKEIYTEMIVADDQNLNVDSLKYFLEKHFNEPIRDDNFNISDLLKDLKQFRIDSFASIKLLIEKHKSTFAEENERLIGFMRASPLNPSGLTSSGMTPIGKIRFALRREFGNAAEEHFTKEYYAKMKLMLDNLPDDVKALIGPRL